MKLTWFGHSAFALEFADVKILIDPFLSGNPKFDGDIDTVSAGCTHVLLTHGHDDHVGDTLAILKATEAQLVAIGIQADLDPRRLLCLRVGHAVNDEIDMLLDGNQHV